MTVSTAGVQLQTDRRWLADGIELVSSMRFAISLLSLLAIASIIGTVLKQNEPLPNYVNQFGPFWFDVFGKLGLYSVYAAWWFLLILAFLVLSTSLCITRNAPKMLKDMRSWRENVREQSLRNFHHKQEWDAAVDRNTLTAELARRIAANGYKVKIVEKGHATLIAAKQGAANKWGYIFAHGAIVIICIGGLLDSDLPIKFQQWYYGKTAFAGNGIIADIPAQHRLGLGNPTFRGNTLIPEGGSSNTAIIQQQSGVLIQDLPFTIQLKKFVIDYYSTGMPKLFASQVLVTDNETGKSFPATIKVNEPLIYKGLAVYQSSFEDGGSKLSLSGYPMQGIRNYDFPVVGEVGGSTPLGNPSGAAYTVEFSGFRPFNVENMNPGSSNDAGSTNCATRPARRANTIITCCRRPSTVTASSWLVCAKHPMRSSAICAFPPMIKAASKSGCDCARPSSVPSCVRWQRSATPNAPCRARARTATSCASNWQAPPKKGWRSLPAATIRAGSSPSASSWSAFHAPSKKKRLVYL